jgi:hypothetical protein
MSGAALYLLYWYKSAGTDAKRCSDMMTEQTEELDGEHADVCVFCSLTYADVC